MMRSDGGPSHERPGIVSSAVLGATAQEAAMRQKTRMSVRRRRRPDPVATGQDPAEWLLENETGWGMPHGIVAVIAGAVVAARAIGFYLDRRTAARSRRDAPPD